MQVCLIPKLFLLYPPHACIPLLPPPGSLAHSGYSVVSDVIDQIVERAPGRPELLQVWQNHFACRVFASFKSCICWLVWNASFIHLVIHSFNKRMPIQLAG